MSAQINKCALIFAGDYNINVLHIIINMLATQFIDCSYSYGLFPTISLPTRMSMHMSSLIDNIFVSDSSIFLSGLIHLDISDHLPIFVALKSSNQPVIKDNMNVVTRVVNQIRIDKLTRYLSSVT